VPDHQVKLADQPSAFEYAPIAPLQDKPTDLGLAIPSVASTVDHRRPFEKVLRSSGGSRGSGPAIRASFVLWCATAPQMPMRS